MTHKFTIISLLFLVLFGITSCDSDNKSNASKTEESGTPTVVEEKSTTGKTEETTVVEAVTVDEKAEETAIAPEASAPKSELVAESDPEVALNPTETSDVAEEKSTTEQNKEVAATDEVVTVDEKAEKTAPEVAPAPKDNKGKDGAAAKPTPATPEVAPNLYAGKYDILDDPQPTTVEKGKIEVLEIFSYMCPHCFHFNNYLQKWLKTKPEDVEFVHLPVVYRDSWHAVAKAYFVAESLGILDKVHNPIFNAIHKGKRPLNSEKALARLFVKQGGITEETFSEFYNSFSVDSQIRVANTTANKYGVKGVPAIIVNGKYRLSTEKSGGYKQMMQVVDYLIEKERKLMADKDKDDKKDN